MKIVFKLLSVVYDYYARIFIKRNDVGNLVLFLVSTLFHANIYFKMAPSYRGDFSVHI